jgi:RNA polymerase sigma-70 factor (ECF subfamily)
VTPETIQGLYRSHAFAVFRRCRRLLGGDLEADDAVQEVFLRLLEDPGRFQGQSSPATFLYAIATHVCLNRLRGTTARGAAWQADVARGLAEVSPGPAATVEARQLAGAILDETDPETAAMAVYHFVDGLPQGEIAALVGRSRVTVNQRLQQLRRDALRRSEAP